MSASAWGPQHQLVDEHVDLALRVGVLPSSGMIAKSLGEVRRVVCASPHYLARRAAPQHPGCIGGTPCIGFDVLDAGYGWRFVVDGKDHLVPIRPRLVVNSAEAAVDAASTGFDWPACCHTRRRPRCAR